MSDLSNPGGAGTSEANLPRTAVSVSNLMKPIKLLRSLKPALRHCDCCRFSLLLTFAQSHAEVPCFRITYDLRKLRRLLNKLHIFLLLPLCCCISPGHQSREGRTVATVYKVAQKATSPCFAEASIPTFIRKRPEPVFALGTSVVNFADPAHGLEAPNVKPIQSSTPLSTRPGLSGFLRLNHAPPQRCALTTKT